jgi:hypothetical protein
MAAAHFHVPAKNLQRKDARFPEIMVSSLKLIILCSETEWGRYVSDFGLEYHSNNLTDLNYNIKMDDCTPFLPVLLKPF